MMRFVSFVMLAVCFTTSALAQTAICSSGPVDPDQPLMPFEEAPMTNLNIEFLNIVKSFPASAFTYVELQGPMPTDDEIMVLNYLAKKGISVDVIVSADCAPTTLPSVDFNLTVASGNLDVLRIYATPSWKLGTAIKDGEVFISQNLQDVYSFL